MTSKEIVMGLLLRWLRANRRRRFVNDGSAAVAVDSGADTDAAVTLALAVSGDTSSYCDTSTSAYCCDTSPAAPSFDGGACSAPPDTSSSTY